MSKSNSKATKPTQSASNVKISYKIMSVEEARKTREDNK